MKPNPHQTTSSPESLARAKAMLAMTRRRQDLYSQALFMADTAADTATVSPTTSDTSLDAVVNTITDSSHRDLLASHNTLNQARKNMHSLLAQDEELSQRLAVLHGPALKLGRAPVVIEGQAQEIPPE